MIPRLGDGNVDDDFDPYSVLSLENDSPSRGRKPVMPKELLTFDFKPV